VREVGHEGGEGVCRSTPVSDLKVWTGMILEESGVEVGTTKTYEE
jgi:hypothetical protein